MSSKAFLPAEAMPSLPAYIVILCLPLATPHCVPTKIIRLKGTPRPSGKRRGGVSTQEPPSWDSNKWIFFPVCFKSGNMELSFFFPLSDNTFPKVAWRLKVKV